MLNYLIGFHGNGDDNSGYFVGNNSQQQQQHQQQQKRIVHDQQADLMSPYGNVWTHSATPQEMHQQQQQFDLDVSFKQELTLYVKQVT